MKPEELRIGNWIESYYFTMGFNDGKDGERSLGYKQVTSEWLSIIEKSKIADGVYMATCHPIPLTHELLKKCKFKTKRKDKNTIWYIQEKFILEMNGIDARFTLKSSKINTVVIWLHQLQNLYFSLTGNELNYMP